MGNKNIYDMNCKHEYIVDKPQTDPLENSYIKIYSVTCL